MNWKHYLNPVILLIIIGKFIGKLLAKTPVWLLMGIAVILVAVSIFGMMI